MSITNTLEYSKFVLQKDDLLFLNRIQLDDRNVLTFLRSVMPHSERQGKNETLYNVGLGEMSFKITKKKGLFVQTFPSREMGNRWALFGHKGFAYEAIMYDKNGRKNGKYVLFYEPYSLEYHLVKKSRIKLKALVRYVHFGEKPIVKYTFVIGNKRVKRYFYISRRSIRAFGERVLAGPVSEDK